MEAFTKAKAYANLSDIKDLGINVTKYIKEVANSDSVPYSTLIFINKYKPIDQLYTYNKIYENRRKNPLYKNLVNENASNEEKLVALSSFLTQILIRNKELVKLEKCDDANSYLKLMSVDTITDTISEYVLNNNTDKLNETFMMIRDMFKKLYS